MESMLSIMAVMRTVSHLSELGQAHGVDVINHGRDEDGVSAQLAAVLLGNSLQHSENHQDSYSDPRKCCGSGFF